MGNLQEITSKKNVARLSQFADFSVTRGEVNQTILQEYIHENSSYIRMIKGAEIGQYIQNPKLKQGSREWFDENTFLQTKPEKPVVATQ